MQDGPSLVKEEIQSGKDGRSINWQEVQYELLVSIESGLMLFGVVGGGTERGKTEAEPQG